MNKIILASGSPRRKELLGALYKDFAIIPAKGDEVTTRKIPSEIVSELAYGKAAEVYDRALELDEYFNSDFLVIGSDTVVAYKDEIMGKPKDEEDGPHPFAKIVLALDDDGVKDADDQERHRAEDEAGAVKHGPPPTACDTAA